MADHARSDDPGVQAQLDRFAQLSPGRDILGLERITALLAALGDPHRALPPVFHVAGTNGKGSTCAFLRAALEAAGQHVHVYTSPHLIRFNERIRLAGTLIDDDALAPLLREVLDVAATYGIGPSFFEATTAAAFLAFSRKPADACIIEVGLGGRLDATNVIKRPVVCGIAQIGIDHQAFLGETIEEIAGEKAGIAKAGVPLVALAQSPAALSAIEHQAEQAGAPLLLEGREWALDPRLFPSLPGDHQVRNANLAAQMLRVQQTIVITEEQIRQGVRHATWPGRLQRLAKGPLSNRLPAGAELWVDGAHNPAAAQVLASELHKHAMHLIVGILANKDVEGIMGALAPHAASLTFVSVPGHDSADPNRLAAHWGGRVCQDVEEAIGHSPGDTLVVGSLYLAGEVLKLNGETLK